MHICETTHSDYSFVGEYTWQKWSYIEGVLSRITYLQDTDQKQEVLGLRQGHLTIDHKNNAEKSRKLYILSALLHLLLIDKA
jgi:hypothetical protein